MRTNPVLTPSKVRYISHLGHTPNIAEATRLQARCGTLSCNHLSSYPLSGSCEMLKGFGLWRGRTDANPKLSLNDT